MLFYLHYTHNHLGKTGDYRIKCCRIDLKYKVFRILDCRYLYINPAESFLELLRKEFF